MVNGNVNLNDLVLSVNGQPWQEDQKELGFELEVLAFGNVQAGSPYKGFDSAHIYTVMTENGRATEDWIEDGIKNRWREGIRNRAADFQNRAEIRTDKDGWEELYVDGTRNMFNGDRLRIEGISSAPGNNGITFYLSPEKFATHDYVKTLRLPKQYQANLHTINGIVITSDGYTISGIRTNLVDQSGEEHILPLGFIDPVPIPKPGQTDNPTDVALARFFRDFTLPGDYVPELPENTAQRRFQRDLAIEGDYSQIFKAPPRLIGVVYNSLRNKDMTASIVMETNIPSEAFAVGQDRKAYELILTPTDQDSLAVKIAELARRPERSSGHLRGDLALLSGYLYGADGFRDTMSQAARFVARYQ